MGEIALKRKRCGMTDCPLCKDAELAEHIELAALRALRDAVGRYIDGDTEDFCCWIPVVEAYEKAKKGGIIRGED